MLVDKQSELMTDLLFTVHQHGGDDVTWKPPIGNFDLFTTQLFAEVPYFCFAVNSCSYMTCTIQEILPSFQDPVSTTKNLPVFFFRVLCHCFTLEENCMYIYLDILTLVLSPKEGGGG